MVYGCVRLYRIASFMQLYLTGKPYQLNLKHGFLPTFLEEVINAFKHVLSISNGCNQRFFDNEYGNMLHLSKLIKKGQMAINRYQVSAPRIQSGQKPIANLPLYF